MLLTIATPVSVDNASNTLGLIFRQEREPRSQPVHRLAASYADGSNLAGD